MKYTTKDFQYLGSTISLHFGQSSTSAQMYDALMQSHAELLEALEECLIGLAATDDNLCARIAAAKARDAIARAKGQK